MTQPNTQPSMPNLTSRQWALLAAAALAFIFTFLPFDGYSGVTENAWNGIGVLGCLLVIVALLAVLAELFFSSSVPRMPVSLSMIAAGAAVLALIFFIIRWLTLPDLCGGADLRGLGIKCPSLSLQWSGYILLILCIVVAVLAFMTVRDAGEAMPWANRSGGTTGTTGMGGTGTTGTTGMGGTGTTGTTGTNPPPPPSA